MAGRSGCAAARPTLLPATARLFAIRCASPSYNFDLASDVQARGSEIFGSWSEARRYSVAHDGFPRPSVVSRTAHSLRIDVVQGITASTVSAVLPEPA